MKNRKKKARRTRRKVEIMYEVKLATFLFLITLVFFNGCNLFAGSPTSVVSSYIDYAKNGDVDSMSRLVSKKAAAQFGATDISTKNKELSDEIRRSILKHALMYTTEERIAGDKAVVKLKKTDPQGNYAMVPDTFQMVKEDGAWKIDGFYP